MPSAYLDHAASTPMRPEAIAAVVLAMERVPGNPSGQHRWARDARRLLDDARDGIAPLLGFEPGGIVFTSGGTEADDLAISGVAQASGGRALGSAAEHHAVLDAVHARHGGTIAVDPFGHVDLDHLAAELEADRGISIVSVMLANNEVGTVTDLHAVAAVLDEARPHHPHGLWLHTDAVAAAAWIDVATAAAAAHLVTISGHKVGGPKGIGVLAVRDGVPLAAQLRGGSQERGRRSGTPNVAGAAGLGVALAASARDRIGTSARVTALRDRLVEGLIREASSVRVTVGARTGDHLPYLAHLTVHELESEPLLFLLDQEGVAASAGSSCASGALEPSHVLTAIGTHPDWARGALRLSLGWCTTDEEIDHALEVIPRAIDQLRVARGQERAS